MMRRWLAILLMLLAQNAPALSRAGLEATHLCRVQGVEVIYLNASGVQVEPNQSECDCQSAELLLPANSAASVGFPRVIPDAFTSAVNALASLNPLPRGPPSAI